MDEFVDPFILYFSLVDKLDQDFLVLVANRFEIDSLPPLEVLGEDIWILVHNNIQDSQPIGDLFAVSQHD